MHTLTIGRKPGHFFLLAKTDFAVPLGERKTACFDSTAFRLHAGTFHIFSALGVNIPSLRRHSAGLSTAVRDTPNDLSLEILLGRAGHGISSLANKFNFQKNID